VSDGAFQCTTDLTLGGHPLETSPNCWIAQRVAAAIEAIGADPTPGGVQFGTDASCFANAGIPGVVVGPGHIDQAHTAVEWVEIEQVEKAAVIYERICTGE
jgi:acetylornithine deacetylase